ncbi:MAG: hypothetical protein V7709_06785 [Halioglobus sp.]
MDHNQDRARDLLPAIIITVLSMIQALALEIYWTKIGESQFLWLGGWDAVIGWMQLLVVFLGMLLIWILYIGVVLRFSWVPTMEDTLIPFYIGLLEFIMIDLMGPGFLGPWFLLLAAIFSVSTWANHMVMRQARGDPANDYFFKHYAPSGWRDYIGSIVVIATLALLGVILWMNDAPHVLTVIAMVFALMAVARQFVQARRYWMHSMIAKNEG